MQPFSPGRAGCRNRPAFSPAAVDFHPILPAAAIAVQMDRGKWHAAFRDRENQMGGRALHTGAEYAVVLRGKKQTARGIRNSRRSLQPQHCPIRKGVVVAADVEPSGSILQQDAGGNRRFGNFHREFCSPIPPFGLERGENFGAGNIHEIRCGTVKVLRARRRAEVGQDRVSDMLHRCL